MKTKTYEKPVIRSHGNVAEITLEKGLGPQDAYLLGSALGDLKTGNAS